MKPTFFEAAQEYTKLAPEMNSCEKIGLKKFFWVDVSMAKLLCSKKSSEVAAEMDELEAKGLLLRTEGPEYVLVAV